MLVRHGFISNQELVTFRGANDSALKSSVPNGDADIVASLTFYSAIHRGLIADGYTIPHLVDIPRKLVWQNVDWGYTWKRGELVQRSKQGIATLVRSSSVTS